jgi:hypothetical protein
MTIHRLVHFLFMQQEGVRLLFIWINDSHTLCPSDAIHHQDFPIVLLEHDIGLEL